MRLCKFHCHFIAQQPACCFILMCCCCFNAFAQHDTTVVDTVSFSKIDSLTAPVDNDDAYADTTIKHIYDTSQYFFNWKDDFRKPYTNVKFSQRHLIDEDVKALKASKDFWYVPAVEKIERRLKTDAAYRDSLIKAGNVNIDAAKKDFRLQPWFHFLIWFVIIMIFLAALIYFLTRQKINFFSKQSASLPEYADEEFHENIFKLSYDDLLRKAEHEQNYRIAIRLLFLQTLKMLSETNHIRYQPDYTNLHYLQQLHQSKLYNDFASLTRNYEYVWYGKFELQQERFTSVKNNFIMFQHKIT